SVRKHAPRPVFRSQSSAMTAPSTYRSARNRATRRIHGFPNSRKPECPLRGSTGTRTAYTRSRSSLFRAAPELTWRPGAAALLVSLALAASCRPSDDPDLAIIFCGRTPAAVVADRSWCADPDSSCVLGFDGTLKPVHLIQSERLATPVAVAALGTELLVS